VDDEGGFGSLLLGLLIVAVLAVAAWECLKWWWHRRRDKPA
jgi:hypothetical protein